MTNIEFCIVPFKLFSIFSPAGGCLLAMTCDYRAMLGPKFTIGLNETQLGIVAPYWFKDTMVNTIGTRQTELALMMGTLFTSEQALGIGLVDEVHNEHEAVLAAATKKALQLSKIPKEARHITKMLMRQPTIDKLPTELGAAPSNKVGETIS